MKLTYHGVGDYWEDVGQHIRNHGNQMKFFPEDKEFPNSLSEGKPPTKIEPGINCEDVVYRVWGAIAGSPDKSCFYPCCDAHGNTGLFYAWDGTLRYQDGTARVNLPLTRLLPGWTWTVTCIMK